MNAHAPVRAEQAAPERHRFTVADLEAMTRAGVLDADADVELIEGEIWDVPSDSPRNRDYAAALFRWLAGNLGPEYLVIPDKTLILSDVNAPQPGWYVFHESVRTADVRGPDVLLAIEQSDSTLRTDLEIRADLYARHGVRDYWAIDPERRRVFVHRGPSGEGYAAMKRYEADEAVQALLLPGLTLRLADLPVRD